jgi:flagellar export protein FliJ
MLINLAKESTDEAARLLGRLNAERGNAERQLGMLHDYRQDYLERLQQAMTNGMSASDCKKRCIHDSRKKTTMQRVQPDNKNQTDNHPKKGAIALTILLLSKKGISNTNHQTVINAGDK